MFIIIIIMKWVWLSQKTASKTERKQEDVLSEKFKKLQQVWHGQNSQYNFGWTVPSWVYSTGRYKIP